MSREIIMTDVNIPWNNSPLEKNPMAEPGMELRTFLSVRNYLNIEGGG